MHDIIYLMKSRKYHRGFEILKPGDDTTSLFFLQDGLIEIFTKTESGDDFVLEKLFPGSVINYRTFFLESDAMVYFRFGRDSYCRELPFSTLKDLLNKHSELKREFNMYKQKTMLQSQTGIPLDYIMVMPKYLRE